MKLQFQDWLVDTTLNQLQRGEECVLLQPLAMNVLACLLEHADQVVSVDRFLDSFWSGRHAEPGMVARCIAQIRSGLGDDARNPRYVETVRKRGYRAIGPIGRPEEKATSVPLSSIAVVPFDDLSPLGDHAWLSNGLAEELISALARIDGLRVTTRYSADVAKKAGADVHAIGRRLDVGSVVQGAVQAVGESVTVVVHWIEVDDELRLWSGRYQRSLADVFEVQNEIAVGIAEAIRTEMGITDAPSAVLAYRYRTQDVRAWTLVRQAAELAKTIDVTKQADACDLLRRAIAIDPEYSAAFGLLARFQPMLDHRVGNRLIPGDAEGRVANARRALEFDPTNADAYFVFAYHSWVAGDRRTMKRLLDRGIRYNPNHSVLLNLSARALLSDGDFDAALVVAHRATRVDPLMAPAHMNVGRAQLFLGNHEAAVEALEAGVALAVETGEESGPHGHLAEARLCLARAYHAVGRAEEATATLLDAFPEHADAARAGVETGGWCGMNRALGEALMAVEDPDPIGGPFRHPHNHRESLFLAADCKDSVYRCLDLKSQAPEYGIVNCGFTGIVTPAFLLATLPADYLAESRFQAVIERMQARVRRTPFRKGIAFLESHPA
ncbi:MAG: winged helix-turn-helix domain-containing protein [Pseudomonadales bacterium]